jgi:amino acid transporter
MVKSSDSNHPSAPPPQLGLWDAVSIIVGIVVGTAIYKVPPIVFQNTAGPWQAMGLWLFGGCLSLIGACCYAELATTYPRSGGDYEYLGRAFGRWVGFLFGWAQLTVVLSGCIGAMAYAFADYAIRLFNYPPSAVAWLATVAVVGLTLINALGLAFGKSAQNILNIVKVLGLAAIVFAAFAAPASQESIAFEGSREISYGLALVFILYAYGGWNDAAFVAAEVRDQSRNVPRALFLGIAGITLIYLLINASYLIVLGFDAAQTSMAPAADVLGRTIGPWGEKGISLLVMISALGAINGMILTGSRVYATLGGDYPRLNWLGKWNRERATPLVAMALQSAFALALIMAVGTARGQAAVDTALGAVGIPALPWAKYFGGFETLVAGSAPVFWTFFLMTGVAVIVLRIKNPDRPRPYSVPCYPLPPIVFCATCGFMLWSSLDYARWLSLLGVVPLALGVPVYLIVRCNKNT